MVPDLSIFENRREAGQRLGSLLRHEKDLIDKQPLVLALARGGVPVACEIAEALSLPIDVLVVRKLGAPDQRELAIGAIAPGGITVLNKDVIQSLGITKENLETMIQNNRRELLRRELSYRALRSFPNVEGQNVLIVDDGVATGATMRAAVQAVRSHKAAWIAIAVPVAEASVCASFAPSVNMIYCLQTPEKLHGVGMWYHDFTQLNDEDVHQTLLEYSYSKELR